MKREMVSLVIKTTASVAGKILSADDQKRLSEEAAKELSS